LNPDLRGLLGGVNTVILSSQERATENAVSKTRNERKMNPAFDVCIELLGLHKWRVHYDVAAAVDAVLRQLDEVVDCEVRELHPETGLIKITHECVRRSCCFCFVLMTERRLWLVSRSRGQISSESFKRPEFWRGRIIKLFQFVCNHCFQIVPDR
jgi:hypothetical protein